MSLGKGIDCKKINFRGGNNVLHNFSDYKTLKEYFGNPDGLKKYGPTKVEYIEKKLVSLPNAENLYNGI